MTAEASSTRRYMIARGRSMGHSLPQGAILCVRSLECTNVRVGDLVVFEGPNGLVCHRVIRRRADSLFCVGDASYHGEQVPLCAVVGCVTSVNGRLTRRWYRVPLKRAFTAWKRSECTVVRITADFPVLAGLLRPLFQWWRSRQWVLSPGTVDDTRRS